MEALEEHSARKVALIRRSVRLEWSDLAIAKAVGTSPMSVQRIPAIAGLKPYIVNTFKLSNAP